MALASGFLGPIVTLNACYLLWTVARLLAFALALPAPIVNPQGEGEMFIVSCLFLLVSKEEMKSTF